MKTILHIDDDIVVLEAYGEKFREAGFHVVSRQSLDRDFVSQICDIAPDLVVSDVSMPTSGVEILKGLRADERTKQLRFVFLSNSLDCDIEEVSRELGALKPMFKLNFLPNEAAKMLQNILNPA